MKILILGSTGMAGHVITQYLRQQGHRVITAGRQSQSLWCDHFIDIENTESANNIANIAEDIDYVINCIGLLVKDCDNRPDRALLINSWFPRLLAEKFKNTKTQVIHISTDCVFNGSQGRYIESDVPTETNFYGRTKHLGEIVNDKDITFRCSIIGPELKNGTGLLNWFRFQAGDSVQGWTNAFWNGMTTLQLAKCLDLYIIQNCKFSGLYHLVDNNLRISKYEMLRLFNKTYHTNKNIQAVTLDKTIDKTLLDTRQSINWMIPKLETQLEELRDFHPPAHM